MDIYVNFKLMLRKKNVQRNIEKFIASAQKQLFDKLKTLR